MDRQADDNGFFPECDDGSERLSFLAWYERWLDKGISKLK